jgi:hypothetical protein
MEVGREGASARAVRVAMIPTVWTHYWGNLESSNKGLDCRCLGPRLESRSVSSHDQSADVLLNKRDSFPTAPNL